MTNPAGSFKGGLAFVGMGERSGPLCWSQIKQCNDMLKARSGDPRYVVSHVMQIVGEPSVSVVLAALERLVYRFESLRSRILVSPKGSAYQVVAGSGVVRMEIVEESCEELSSGALELMLREDPFDISQEVPWRIGLVVRGGVVLRYVGVYPHTAVDAQSVMTIEGFLSSTIESDGRAMGPHRLPIEHPIDRALYERTDAGVVASRRGEQHWKDVLTQSPPELLVRRLSSPVARFGEVEVLSLGAGWALWEIGRRCRSFPSATLLAACAQVLGRACGRNEVVFQFVSAGRLTRNSKHSVGAFATETIVCVDVAGAFEKTVRSTAVSVVEALDSPTISPDRLLALCERESERRGRCLDIDYHFNFYGAHRDQNTMTDPHSGMPAGVIRWTGEHRERKKFYISASVDDAGLWMRVGVDLDFMSRIEIETFARNVQSLLMTSGSGK